MSAASNPPEAESKIENLVLEVLDALEHEGDSALERVCSREPSLASRVRARIASLKDAGLISFGDGGPFPEQLGDFRLLERLGSGGMGVVYLAEQLSLARRVALKLIRPDQLYFGDARARFRREAEAIGRLAHPSIVPIHVVGEEAGIPYFAMEYVRGLPLSRVLRELRSVEIARLKGADFLTVLERDGGFSADVGGRALFEGSFVDVCLRIARAVAGALAHAHERKILHRDVKPSNVMLTATGRVLLHDFGLASRQGADRMTGTGAQVGSLAYMAPEQIEGRAAELGPVTDVYGLGATLYEMLALRAPYRDESATALMRAIVMAAPPSLREQNRAVSRDAETVVFKAMSGATTRRYASAEAFAADLENLLARRPIDARRSSMIEKGWRFAQRDPGAATAIVLAGVLLAGVPTALAVQQSAARARLEQANDATKAANTRLQVSLEETLAERSRAESNFSMALESVSLLTRVGNTGLADQPQAEQARREILESALSFHERLLAARKDDPRLILETARSQLDVGEIQTALARSEAATVVLDAALSTFDTLAATSAEADQFVDERTRAYLLRSQSHRSLARTQASRDDLQAIVDLLSPLVERQEAPIELRARLGDTWKQMAAILLRVGDKAGAHTALTRSGEVFVALAQEYPTEGLYAAEVGEAYVQIVLNSMQYRAGENDEVPDTTCRRGVEVLEKALPLLKKALRERPKDAALRGRLAVCERNLGTLFHLLNRLDEAIVHFEEAVRVGRELCADFPQTVAAREALVNAVLSMGGSVERAHGPRAAVHWKEEAVSIKAGQVRDFPQKPGYRAGLGMSQANLGRLYYKLEEWEQASLWIERGIQSYDDYLQLQPEDAFVRSTRADAIRGMADVLVELGRPEEGVRLILEREDKMVGTELVTDATVLSRAVWSIEHADTVEAVRAAELSRAWRSEALDRLEAAFDDSTTRWSILLGEDFFAIQKEPRYLAIEARARALGSTGK